MSFKTQLYLHLIKDFCQNHQNLRRQLTEQFEQQRWSELLLTVHSLKSSAAYIGAEPLSKRCAKSEYELEHRRFCRAQITEICRLLEPLLEQLEPVVQSFQGPAAEPISFSDEQLRQQLYRLLPLLAASDFSVEELLPALNQMCADTEFAEPIEQLTLWVNEVEFEKAHQLVANLLDQ